MNENLQTLTVLELITALIEFAREDRKVLKYKVYLSSDPEGNGFSSVDAKMSFQFSDMDKVVALMPYADGLTDDDILPKEMAAIKKEFERKAKENVEKVTKVTKPKAEKAPKAKKTAKKTTKKVTKKA